MNKGWFDQLSDTTHEADAYNFLPKWHRTVKENVVERKRAEFKSEFFSNDALEELWDNDADAIYDEE